MNACTECRERLLQAWIEDAAPAPAGGCRTGEDTPARGGGTLEPDASARIAFESDAAGRHAAGWREAGWAAFAAHLESCPDCRREANALRRIDRALTNGFSSLGEILGPPSDRIIEETVRRVRETPPEVQLIRRVRRPLRIILWGVFYAFTLLASYALAVALLKALRGL